MSVYYGINRNDIPTLSWGCCILLEDGNYYSLSQDFKRQIKNKSDILALNKKIEYKDYLRFPSNPFDPSLFYKIKGLDSIVEVKNNKFFLISKKGLLKEEVLQENIKYFFDRGIASSMSDSELIVFFNPVTLKKSKSPLVIKWSELDKEILFCFDNLWSYEIADEFLISYKEKKDVEITRTNFKKVRESLYSFIEYLKEDDAITYETYLNFGRFVDNVCNKAAFFL